MRNRKMICLFAATLAAAAIASCAMPVNAKLYGVSGLVWGTAAEGYPGLVAPDFGTAIAVGDLTGDGIDDLVAGAPGSGKSARFQAGDIYVLAGPIEGTIDLATQPPLLALRGQSPVEYNGSILALADMDGDGVRDIVTVSNGTTIATAHSPGYRAGRAAIRVVSGTLRGEQPLEASAYLNIVGPSSTGGAVVVGDYNGDGRDDLVLTAPLWGEMYVLLGPRTGTMTLPDAADLRLTLPEGSLGRRMAAADADGDGKLDLLIDAPAAGRVYLLPGGLTGDHAVEAAASAVFVGSGEGIESLAAGDLTGDGVVDFVFAAQRADDPERSTLHVVAGPVASEIAIGAGDLITITDLPSWSTAKSLVVIPGFAGYERALVAGAYTRRSNKLVGGSLWAFDGEIRGKMSASKALARGRAWSVRGEDIYINGLGFAVAAGDVDGDGVLDAVASAPPADRNAVPFGAVLVFSGARQ